MINKFIRLTGIGMLNGILYHYNHDWQTNIIITAAILLMFHGVMFYDTQKNK